MKKLLKNITVIIVVIMVLLSSFATKPVLATETDLPSYEGLPEGGRYGVVNITGWFINSLKDIFNWFVGISTYLIKAVFLGWANVIEKALTALVTVGTDSAVEGSLTIEKIVSNQVPILDVNFFDFTHAGGQELTQLTGTDHDNTIFVIRQSIAQFYFIIRNLTIGGMLITLIYVGIRMAISSIAEAKAKYKAMLIGWVESMVLVFTIHYIMVFIVKANEWLISIIYTTVGGEEALYDVIRNQSYAVQFNVGWPATIIYIILIALLVRFIIIYFKRFVNVAILTFLAPVIAIGFAIDKIKDGKSQSFSKWLKDYTTNVFIQSVHCLLYFMFIKLAFDMAGQSIYGVILALFLILCIKQGENTFKKIFNLGTNSAKLAGIGEEKGSLKGTIAKFMAISGAIDLNRKLLGKAATPFTKGFDKVKSSIRSSRVNNIRQALDNAITLGEDVIRYKPSLLSKTKDKNVGQIIETGNELGYSTQDMAELIQSEYDEEANKKREERKEKFKKGRETVGSMFGLATSAALFPNDPIAAIQVYSKYSKKLKKNIKGFKKTEFKYSGSISQELKNASKYWGANAGIALSIPAMTASPLLGSIAFIKFLNMRSKVVEGYKTNNGRYVGDKSKIERAKKFASSYGNFNTLYTVPMIKQLAQNIDEERGDKLIHDISAEYRLSNKMLEDMTQAEYDNLVNNYGIDPNYLDELIKRAKKNVSENSIEKSIEKVNTNHTVKDRTNISSFEEFNNSYRAKYLTIDIDRTEDMRNSTKGNDIVVKANNIASVEDFAEAVMDLKMHAITGKTLSVHAEFGGVEFSANSFTNVDQLVEAIRNDPNVDKNKLRNEPQNKSEQSNMDLADVKNVIKEVAKGSSNIKEDKLEENFTEIIKEKISKETGVDKANITSSDINSEIARMSKDSVTDAIAIAGTKNSSTMEENTAPEFKKLLTLIEKEKFNDYVIRQISYDRNQAKDVAERIRKNKAKGVK